MLQTCQNPQDRALKLYDLTKNLLICSSTSASAETHKQEMESIKPDTMRAPLPRHMKAKHRSKRMFVNTLVFSPSVA